MKERGKMGWMCVSMCGCEIHCGSAAVSRGWPLGGWRVVEEDRIA